MSNTLAFIIVLSGIAIFGYLLGSVSFAIIFTRIFSGVDVRDFGSKNAGMTNVSRVAGKKAAILTLICDVAKGAVAVLVARYLGIYLLDLLTAQSIENTVNPLIFAYLGGYFCVLGHIYPLYFKFHGGKGVASMLGILLFVDWRSALLVLLMFIIVVLFTRIVSLGSLSAAVAYPIATYFLYEGANQYTYTMLGMNQHIIVTLCALLYGLTLFYTHRSNIVRLIHGTENKIGSKKKSE